MFKKKAQGAVEFMLILCFIFVIVGLVMYFTGEYLIEINAKEQQKLAEDYTDKINNELQILSKVEPGYTRELILRNQNYDIRLINSTDGRPSTLIINDIYNNQTYYFDLIGNYNLNTGNLEINLTKRLDPEFNFNVTVLTFKKNKDSDLNGLDLSN